VRRFRPLSGTARRSYLVVAAPRTGTTLLCELLRWDRVFGRPEEYFEPQHIANYSRRWGVPDPNRPGSPTPPYLEEMLRAGTTRNGVFGAKLLTEQVDGALQLFGIDPTAPLARARLAEVLPALRLVHLRRSDKVAAAVSLWRAKASGQWLRRHWQATAEVGPDLDLGFVTVNHARHHESEKAWDEVLAAGVPGLTLEFEDLVRDPEPAVDAVADLLGVRWVPKLHRGTRLLLPHSQSDGSTSALIRAWVDHTGGCDECGHPGT